MLTSNPAIDLRRKALEARTESTLLFQHSYNLLRQGKQVEAKKTKQSAMAKSEETTRLVRAACELEQNFVRFCQG